MMYTPFRNSLGRIPALGADGGVGTSSLMLQGGFLLSGLQDWNDKLQKILHLGHFQLRL